MLEKKGEVEAKVSVREHTGPLFTVSGTPPDSDVNLVFTGDYEGIIKALEVPKFKGDTAENGDLIKGSWLVGEPEETVIWQLAYQDDVENGVILEISIIIFRLNPKNPQPDLRVQTEPPKKHKSLDHKNLHKPRIQHHPYPP